MTTVMTTIRMAMVGLLLAFGAAWAAPAIAQDTTPETSVEEEAEGVVGGAQEEAEDVVEDDDEGFEWGLLGLLGLAGLAGLMRRPQPVVHEDLNRTRTTGTRDAIDRDDDRTRI